MEEKTETKLRVAALLGSVAMSVMSWRETISFLVYPMKHGVVKNHFALVSTNALFLNDLPSVSKKFGFVCVVKSCPDLATPSNGTKNTTQTSCGVTVQFSCHECYVLEGSSHLSCLPNKTWIGEEPFCQRQHTHRFLYRFLNYNVIAFV